MFYYSVVLRIDDPFSGVEPSPPASSGNTKRINRANLPLATPHGRTGWDDIVVGHVVTFLRSDPFVPFVVFSLQISAQLREVEPQRL